MSGSWVAAGASARGAAHIRAGKPNQDFAGWIGPKHGEAVISAAVSDGHGAPAHDRSHVGSALAVGIALGEASRLSVTDDGLPPQRLADADGLLGRIHTQWVRAVTGSGTAGQDDAVLRHGATLVGAHLSGRNLCLFQIGDGDILLVRSSGRVDRPLTVDGGLSGEETHSLCEPDAPRHGHVAVVDVDEGDPVALVMLSTDGVGKSFADDRALGRVALGFSDAAARGRFAEVASRLGQWASDLSARGSGDDASLVLLARIPVAARQPVNQPGADSRPKAASRAAVPAHVVSLAVGAIIGMAAGLGMPRFIGPHQPGNGPEIQGPAEAAPAPPSPVIAPSGPVAAPENPNPSKQEKAP